MKIITEVFRADSGTNVLSPPKLHIPVLIGKNTLSPETCQRICEEILKRENEILNGSSPEYVAGQTDGITTRWRAYNVLTWDFPELTELIGVIKTCYLKFLESEGLPRWKNEITCWANILRDGQELKTHHHSFRNRSVLSASVSLTTSPTATCYVFPFSLFPDGNQNLPLEDLIVPTRSGNLIMIPGWVSHYTTPVASGGPRITLGLDIASIGQIKNAQIPFDSGEEFLI